MWIGVEQWGNEVRAVYGKGEVWMMGWGGGRKNMKTRCQMGLAWCRKTIGNSINVLGITKGAKQEVVGPRSQ
jgi:hypothetical protein